MLDNCIKSIEIGNSAIYRKCNVKVLNKSNTVMKSSIPKLKKIIDNILSNLDPIPYEVKVMNYSNFTKIEYNWDKCNFDKKHKYYNVYAFQLSFNEYLKKVEAALIGSGFDMVDIIVNN